MADRAKIKAYMQFQVDDAVDPRTGEVSATALLEAAADHWDDESMLEEGSTAWEAAAEIASSYNG